MSISSTLNKIGVGLALTFMVMELTYVNAKSLLYLADEFGLIDRLMAVVGSMAFSMVTVIVMRKSAERWPKFVFPLFDAALVFFGINLKFAHNLLENPIAFGLSIFLALFTGLITYSLGIINSREQLQQNEAMQDVYRAKCTKAEADLHNAIATKEKLAAVVQQLAADKGKLADTLQQRETELQQITLKLVQLEDIHQQNKAACTCEYCGRPFPTEAAKRSHIGRCPERLNKKN